VRERELNKNFYLRCARYFRVFFTACYFVFINVVLKIHGKNDFADNI